MGSQVDADDLATGGQGGNVRAEHLDRTEATVEEDERPATTVDLVRERDAVDPCQAARRHGDLGGRARRHNAELLHHRQRIEDTPVLLHTPTVVEAEYVDELHVDALSGCRHAHERTLVGPRVPHSRDRFVTVRDDVFHPQAQVRERCELHPEEILDPRFRRRKARCLLVLDEVVSQMVGEPVDISGVDQVVQASRRSCVIHVHIR